MARLTHESNWLIQQIGGEVILFHEYTEEEVVRFNPFDVDDTAKKQKVIYESTQLTDEEKCFAHFWSGYFYRSARME